MATFPSKGRRLLAAALLLLTVGAASASTMTAEQARQLIERMFGTPQKIDAAIVKMYGQQPAARMEPLRASVRAVMHHPSLPQRFADLINPLAQAGTTPKEAEAAGLEYILSVHVKGMSRLSDDQLALFVRHLLAMTHAVSPSDCRRMSTGEMSTQESAAIERRFVLALPQAQFERIIHLYRTAAVTELNGFPDPRTITHEQAKLTEKALEVLMVRKLQARMSQEAIRRVANDASTAPAVEACTLLQVTLESMLELNQPYRSWQLVRFANAMQ